MKLTENQVRKSVNLLNAQLSHSQLRENQGKGERKGERRRSWYGNWHGIAWLANENENEDESESESERFLVECIPVTIV